MPEKKEKIEEVTEQEVTEQEVWDVLLYANELTQGEFLGRFPNIFNPDLVNDRMQDVTLNPLAATVDNVNSALLAPKDSETELQAYSEHFELTSMPYKRMLHYLGNLLSFDLTYVPKGKIEKKEYTSSKWKNDLEVVNDFFDKFDVKKEFKLIMKQLIRQDVFFGILRDEGDKYTIQELPSKHCKIDGRWDYGLLYAFDLNWFLNSGTDLNMYPDVFKKMYKDAFVTPNEDGYIPSRSVSSRASSSWTYYVDCSPLDGFWGWKFSPEIATRIPYLSALFPDLVLQPLFRELQKNLSIIAATKILLGQIPFIKGDVKTAAKKDQVAVSPEVLGKFLGLMKKGLNEGIKVASAPLEDMQAISFPLEDKTMYEDYLRTTIGASGVNSRLIFSTDKPTQLESRLSVDVDEFLIKYVYPYFEMFLEYYINKRTKKYKFKFKFEGTEFSTDREERLETALKLAEKGVVLPQKISAAVGMQYNDFKKQIEMGVADEFIEMLTPILNASQMGQADIDEAGRPAKSSSKLTESGDQTRADSGNDQKV